ncbi:MAG: prolyl oligopeptidase family serine peptidase [Deltaproteobacteria bacterium]|nr:prolyl oligopeptidase family serine peptidase [Deltaproteobacteria bacterium]
MKRRHELIPSQVMGRRMHVWCYGHWGVPILVFPSAAGMAHEWDAQGMVSTLSDLIQEGRIKLYCCESNVAEAWTRQQNPPEWRIKRHQAFEEYVISELVPFIRRDCQAPEIRIGATGCSLGGYYAANFALKFPEIFHYALCMSGRYDITGFTGGFSNLDVYFNNPLAYASNLEGQHLERVRKHAHLALVCGQGAWEEGCIEETQALADILESKGISHQRDIWGHDVAHDWGWWKREARYHLVQRFGG